MTAKTSIFALVKIIAPCLLLLFLISCKKEDTSSTQSEFTPSGKMTDLMYNPLRADGTVDSSYLPILTWQDENFDFGDLIKGEVAKKEFVFKNTGTAPLLISRATSSCGCSVPKWPKELIMPDSTGIIEVTFNTTNLKGRQAKEVSIFANTIPNQGVLRFHANVLETN